MDELAAKKLGEAVALCGMGAEFVKEYENVLSQIMDKTELEKRQETFADHAQRSEELGEEMGQEDLIHKTADSAREKFIQMRDVFMEGQANDPFRLVSWLTLASAGGLAVWAVLLPLAENMEHEDLQELSEEALEFQKQNLEEDEEALQGLARAGA